MYSSCFFFDEEYTRKIRNSGSRPTFSRKKSEKTENFKTGEIKGKYMCFLTPGQVSLKPLFFTQILRGSFFWCFFDKMFENDPPLFLSKKMTHFLKKTKKNVKKCLLIKDWLKTQLWVEEGEWWRHVPWKTGTLCQNGVFNRSENLVVFLQKRSAALAHPLAGGKTNECAKADTLTFRKNRPI